MWDRHRDFQRIHEFVGVPGHEFVGIVTEAKNKKLVGKKVVGEINVGCGACNECKTRTERHCPNRTVLGIYKRDGAFAEYITLPERNIHVIPHSLRDEEAVFMEPLAAAFEILEQVKISPRCEVAVVGDGKLAQLILQVMALSNKP